MMLPHYHMATKTGEQFVSIEEASAAAIEFLKFLKNKGYSNDYSLIVHYNFKIRQDNGSIVDWEPPQFSDGPRIIWNCDKPPVRRKHRLFDRIMDILSWR